MLIIAALGRLEQEDERCVQGTVSNKQKKTITRNIITFQNCW
jgi:hypothetical protein